MRESCDAAVKKLSSVVGRIKPQTSPDELKQLNSEASRLQKEAESTLRKLEAEAKGSAPSVRRGQLDSIATLKSSLNKARTELQKVNDNVARGELLGSKTEKNKVRPRRMGPGVRARCKSRAPARRRSA